MINKIKCYLGFHTYSAYHQQVRKFNDGYYVSFNQCLYCNYYDSFWKVESESK